MREHSNPWRTLSNWPGLLVNVVRYQSFNRFTYTTPRQTPILVTFYNESRNRNLKTPQLHACWMFFGFWSFLLLCISVLTSKSKGVVRSYFRSHYCWMHFSDNLIWSRAATCLSVYQMHLNLNHLLLIWQFLFGYLLKMALAKTEPFYSFLLFSFLLKVKKKNYTRLFWSISSLKAFAQIRNSLNTNLHGGGIA